MNKHSLKHPLIAIGLPTLVGAVGVQTYYTYALTRRIAADDTHPPAVSGPVSADWQSAPWAAMHADLMRMQARMDRMSDDAFKGVHDLTSGVLQTGGKVTLEEQGGDYVVKADIPAAKDSDIDVNLDGHLLSTSSQTQGQERQTAVNGQVTGQENYSRSVQQAFTRPGPVNASGMHSQYQDGVLTVTIPKANS